MNKEQIKSPFQFFQEKYNGGKSIYVSEIMKFNAMIFDRLELCEFAEQYSNYIVESKRSEIERNAYEAGQKSILNADGYYFVNNKKIPKPVKTYDQWKESQKQEQ